MNDQGERRTATTVTKMVTLRLERRFDYWTNRWRAVWINPLLMISSKAVTIAQRYITTAVMPGFEARGRG
jgi:hypothetical protein